MLFVPEWTSEHGDMIPGPSGQLHWSSANHSSLLTSSAQPSESFGHNKLLSVSPNISFTSETEAQSYPTSHPYNLPYNSYHGSAPQWFLYQQGYPQFSNLYNALPPPFLASGLYGSSSTGTEGHSPSQLLQTSLAEATSSVVNTGAAQTSNNTSQTTSTWHRRTENSDAALLSWKHQHTDRNHIENAEQRSIMVPQISVPSVGPSITIPAEPAISSHSSLLAKLKVSHNASAASDVWYFTHKLTTDKRPDMAPADKICLFERLWNMQFIGCWLWWGIWAYAIIVWLLTSLTSMLPQWQTWKCSTGQTNVIRTHLRKKHWKEWCEEVIVKNLKGWEKLAGLKDQKLHWHSEPFIKEGFIKQLIAWLVIDDQICD